MFYHELLSTDIANYHYLHKFHFIIGINLISNVKLLGTFNFNFTPDDGLWFRPKYRKHYFNHSTLDFDSTP